MAMVGLIFKPALVQDVRVVAAAATPRRSTETRKNH
jgi:hypothetical protein